MSNKILRTVYHRFIPAASIHKPALHDTVAPKYHTQNHFQRERMATSTSTSKPAHYILSFYVPVESTAKVCAEVCQKSGAGSYPGGLYTEAYWITKGTGQFKAGEGSKPAIGTAGEEIEKVEEDKVEILCVGRDCAEKAVKELLNAHPYEQAPYYVVKAEEF